MKYKIIIIFSVGLIALSGCRTTIPENNISTIPEKAGPSFVDTAVDTTKKTSEIRAKLSAKSLVQPVKEFKSRITKKPFGIYITPENSPVKPERFRGYHTGVDVEYGDVAATVPVVAIATGTVIYSGRVSGYGGVAVIRHRIKGKNYRILYGHIKPGSLIVKDTKVKAGEQIGILGRGGTEETDGERKHLHFAVYTGDDLNFRGYVRTEALLEKWVDPLILFEE